MAMQQRQFIQPYPPYGFMPQPVPAFNRPVSDKERYPCRACGVRGHWRNDGKCKPEDVQAHLAKLAAAVPSPMLSLPAPPSTGMERIGKICLTSSQSVFCAVHYCGW